MEINKSRSTLCFYLNDEYVQLEDFRPDKTLLDFIREHGVKGPKGACREGGCGACTVLLTYCELGTENIIHKSVTSCLLPLPKVDGMVVTTVEALGSVSTKLSEIQQAIVDRGATQCGYCTPGFVVTMTDLIFNPEKEAERKERSCNKDELRHERLKDIEEGIDGNLCRCTGYRSILNAASTVMDHLDEKDVIDVLGQDSPLHRAREYSKILAARNSLSLHFVTPNPPSLPPVAPHCDKVSGASSSSQLPSTVWPFPSVEWFRPATLKELLEIRAANNDARLANGCTEIGFQMVNGIGGNKFVDPSHIEELFTLRLDKWGSGASDGWKEGEAEKAKGENASEEAFPVIDEHPITSPKKVNLSEAHSLVIGGNITIEKLIDYIRSLIREAIPPVTLEEMKGFSASKDDPDGFIPTVTHVPSLDLTHNTSLPFKPSPYAYKLRMLHQLLLLCMRFASHHIRALATAVGNISLCSPISDLVSPLMAMNAQVHLLSLRGTRVVPLREFMISSRRTLLAPDEIMTHVSIPLTEELEVFYCTKITKRKEDDISLANAALRMRLREPTEKEIAENKGKAYLHVVSASMFFGGMSWKVVEAKETEKFLMGLKPSAMALEGKNVPQVEQCSASSSSPSASSSSSSNQSSSSSSSSTSMLFSPKDGRSLTRDIMSLCLADLPVDLPLAANAPGGSIHYRRTVCLSLMISYFLSITRLICKVTNHTWDEWKRGDALAREYLKQINMSLPELHDEKCDAEILPANSCHNKKMKRIFDLLDREREKQIQLAFSLPVSDAVRKSYVASEFCITEHRTNLYQSTVYGKEGGDGGVTEGEQSFSVTSEEEATAVGKIVPHLQSKVQTTGETMYTMDSSNPMESAVGRAVQMPRATEGARKGREGTLYGALVLSKESHAFIKNVDTSAALALRGVVGYVSASDIVGVNAIGAVIRDEECFATKEVTCKGQVIGVIVAETLEVAQKGAAAVVVEYDDGSADGHEKLKVISTIEEAIEAKSFFSDKPLVYQKGDYEKGLSESEIVISGTIRFAGQAHVALEAQNTIATYEEDGLLTIAAATQNPALTQRLVSAVCGVPTSQIKVVTKRMGGAFGGKESRSCFVSCAAAVCAQKYKTSVHIQLSRPEDLTVAGMRHPFLAKYRAGLKKEASNEASSSSSASSGSNSEWRVHALWVSLYSNGGNSLDLSNSVLNRAVAHVDNCYCIPHCYAEGRVCKTNRPSNTAFRGFGAPQGVIVTELIMDELSKVIGEDPVVFREHNFYREGEKTHFGEEIKEEDGTGVGSLHRVMTELKESSSFYQRQKEIEDFNSTSRFVKRGIALTPLKFGLSFESRFMNQAGALVHVGQDGSVIVSHGGLEMGQGIHTKMAQIAAEALSRGGSTTKEDEQLYRVDVDLGKVRVRDTSTDTVANTSPTAASSGSDLNGMAVFNACTQIKERLIPYERQIYEQKKKEMEAAGISQSGPIHIPLGDIARAAFMSRVDLSAHGFYSTPGLVDGHPFAYFIWGASVTEVELDCLTGATKVVRADVTYDVGRSLNPLVDIGQLEGAFVQGLGYLMTEEPIFDSKGQMVNNNIGAYKVPAISGVPLDFHASLLKNQKNKFNSIYGSKGIGEPPLILAMSAPIAAKNASEAAYLHQPYPILTPLENLPHAKSTKLPSLVSEKEGKVEYSFDYNLPTTNERLRMSLTDTITEATKQEGVPRAQLPS
ncbi:xanthine dehydrogenase [Monocercomonoides exilis]|uniref:xanthine dehydrogenase n=1 Tax=Monocercomonoides exilis TaxID=2049356 RepID=UPI00355AB6CF|nr:xanthine dehydrogenase [Monocercomonoides exilis]|eukprot:MONOS_130.1-p1 / transcript=MONOS_130.1 / gene=MONOS_130 / organism=Monocercomonoides_exilis_PA203 / gene_product=xanthine dehydrogenase [EC:1.17.1.4] / transcript_product=xanthine dehydrogenase [EC:1.17.1.4] / location=Mono_scaffold00002:247281-252715(-) / protein_length=1703 / sequence_SO=supercontig / SO=protein_coding / is_pseudo=false